MPNRSPYRKLVFTQIKGFSLIELMVTLLIGMIIISGVFQVIVASKRSELDYKEIVYIQENARFALDVLSSDIRMAGYNGCSQTTDQVNVINRRFIDEIGYAGIRGFEGSDIAKLPAFYRDQVKINSDSLVIRRGDPEEERLVRKQSPASNTISLWEQHNFERHQPLTMVDGSCRFSAIFAASQIDNPMTVRHAVSENNCSDILRGRYDCSDCDGYHCPRTLIHSSFLPGARIMPLISNAYYIGDSTLIEGAPALKRQSLAVQRGRLTTRTEELASGVENIQFTYGVDTDNSGSINEYRQANEMDINDDGVIDSRDWLSVKTVKIDMLLVSKSPVFSTPKTVVFNGIDYPGLFMRQVVSTTIQIRNHGA